MNCKAKSKIIQITGRMREKEKKKISMIYDSNM